MVMIGNKSKGLSLFVTALTAAALLLGGCNGGSDGAPGAAGAPGAPGAAGPAGQDLTAKVTVASNATPASSDASAAWAALAPQITITGVTIASPPVVKFTVKDASGKAVVGLGNKSQSSSATVAGLSNVAFTLAKLVPGTNGSPSKWVSYLVVSPPTVAQKTAVPATSSCNAATNATWCGTFPTTDTQGTLVDNGDGTYQYTFYRDPKQVASIVAGLTDSADGLSKKADLGDLTFDPTLTHRLGIQIGGNAPGTGSNTPNAVTLTTAVPMVNTGNAVYDFRPDGGSLTTTRNIVKIDSCSACHAGKVLAHGSRKDPQYCVTCHTDQIRYSFSQEASSTNGGLTLTGTTRQTTAVVDGRALGNFPNMLHHLHMGEDLVKQGYFFNAAAEGQFNDVKYPQDQRNCIKCHDGSASAVNKTANGDNWKNVPSRLACGACHDGINFATGQGVTSDGRTVGHIGGAKADDSLCAVCHDATTIASVYHVAVTPIAPAILASNVASGNTNAASIAAYTDNLPAGAKKITYAMGNVTVDANRHAVVQFKILVDGTAANFGTASSTKTELISGFIGAPSVYVRFGVPMDGITAPADFNANASGYVKTLWNGTATGTGAGTLTGPDANGFYTATLTGVIIPTTATMVTAGIGYTYSLPATQPLTQIDLPAYPFNSTTLIGGLIVAAPDVWKVATGYSPRRTIVENARCNACHNKLGVFTKEAFHSGQRNDAPTCAFCHNPVQSSSGWSAASSTFVHGIHGASKRTTPFTWHATDVDDGFFQIGYPGVLNQCEQCHLPDTYNFGSAYTKTNESAMPTVAAFNNTTADNMLYSLVGSGTYVAGAVGLSPYVTPGVNYGSNFAFSGATGTSTAASGTTLVNSPITSACFSCHDSGPAMSHMRSNGGSIYAPRTTALATKEQCLVCHAAGKIADVKVVHQ